MPTGSEPIVRLHGVTKDYQSLRPLRIANFEIVEGQSVALLGLDAPMAEVLVNLITGASVPDTGEVVVFGQPTTTIADSDMWLAILDRFGLISDRAVLIDQLLAEQSLVMPLSLEFDRMAPDLRAAADALADEVGLTAEDRTTPIARLPSSTRLRVRLGRALALGPRLLLAEHPNAALDGAELPLFASDFARIVRTRAIASLLITADRSFATASAEHVYTLVPATGELKPLAGWRRWFS